MLPRGTSCPVGAEQGLVAPTGAGALAPVLQEVELPLIDSLTCSALLRAMDLPPVQGSMLCAGFPDGGRDACKVRAPPLRLLLGSRPGLPICKPLGREGGSSSGGAVSSLLSKGFPRSFRVTKAGGIS